MYLFLVRKNTIQCVKFAIYEDYHVQYNKNILYLKGKNA